MAALPVAQLRARSVTDRDEIAAYLRGDRRYAAYALGDLDSAASGRCSWGIAYDADGEPTALAMHHDGLVPQPLFLMGDPAGCRAVLASVIKPQASVLARSRGIGCVEVDYDELRGLGTNELKLF